jgi:hypothetical protein
VKHWYMTDLRIGVAGKIAFSVEHPGKGTCCSPMLAVAGQDFDAFVNRPYRLNLHLENPRFLAELTKQILPPRWIRQA